MDDEESSMSRSVSRLKALGHSRLGYDNNELQAV